MADVSAPCLRSYWTHNYISSKVYKQIMTLPSCWSFKYPWEILTVSSKHWKWYLGLPHILPPTTDPHLHWAKRKPPKSFIRGLMNKPPQNITFSELYCSRFLKRFTSPVFYFVVLNQSHTFQLLNTQRHKRPKMAYLIFNNLFWPCQPIC